MVVLRFGKGAVRSIDNRNHGRNLGWVKVVVRRLGSEVNYLMWTVLCLVEKDVTCNRKRFPWLLHHTA